MGPWLVLGGGDVSDSESENGTECSPLRDSTEEEDLGEAVLEPGSKIM